ncbi:hypothetical protein P343_08020 [Sporolactobacillus laevolacticus DSM 442]|uniref:Uncharacterized protein n=1 Tax=Sporolactobacillus laevolacticus DSM 442 TaxID=1395513 RepID=V6IY07_9BACL|nr:hypothetical protein P343_08020 [Sporolactobacillus laevolacticus DSM 442]
MWLDWEGLCPFLNCVKNNGQKVGRKGDLGSSTKLYEHEC